MTIHHLPSFGHRDPAERSDDTAGDCDVDGSDLGFDGFEGGRSDTRIGGDGAGGGLFDDSDETANRFGGLDHSSTFVHRNVTPALLAGLTGVALPICQSFHHILFRTLEDVGDSDGLVVAPPIMIGPRSQRFETAARWVIEHPAPDVAGTLAQINATDEPDQAGDALEAAATRALMDHSLGVSLAANTNPSLTFGSTDALTDRILDDMFEVNEPWSGDEIAHLTDLALALIGCVSDVDGLVGLVGGAQVQVVDWFDGCERPAEPVRTDVRDTL
jgi:hypothetical protein